MPGLNLYTSNRLEILAEILAEVMSGSCGPDRANWLIFLVNAEKIGMVLALEGHFRG
jgi:hypothetical protein